MSLETDKKIPDEQDLNGQNPNGQNPNGQNPNGQNPKGQNPNGQSANGKNRDEREDEKKEGKKRLSEAERLQRETDLQKNYLRSGKQKSTTQSDWIRNQHPGSALQSFQQTTQHLYGYTPSQATPPAIYPQTFQNPWPYAPVNQNYGFPPMPQYQQNPTGSLPQLSNPSSGDERKTVLDIRRSTEQQGELHAPNEDGQSSESEPESTRERSFSAGDQGLNGRASYRNSFMKDITSRLAVFSGEHFARWEREAKRVLELTGYIRYITTDYSLATGKVRREDQIVAAYIEQHIAVEIKNELNLATGSAYDVWSALKYWHDDRDCSELDRTYSKMRSIKLNGEAIEEYKKEFLDILKSLAKFGRAIPPDFLVHIFLEGLGERGAHYRREYKRKQHLDPKTVCLEVCRSFEVTEKRRVDHVSKPNKHPEKKPKFTVSKLPFFQSRARPNPKESTSKEGDRETTKKIYLGKQSEKQAGVCWKCGDPNHQFKDCPKLKGGIRVLINIVSQAHQSMRWIFDTGAAVAVVNSEKWFNKGTFTPTELTFGSIDTGGTLEAIGYGEVTLKLKCGIEVTIPNVFLCPKASVNVMTNIDLDPRIRFLIDSERGYMWANEQDENDFYEFCKVVNDQNVIQLDDSVVNPINAVTTRRSNPNRTDSEEPQKKRLKSVVSYAVKDSKQNPTETADPKKQPNLRTKLKKPQQKESADPKPQEDLRQKLNRSKKHQQKGENPKVADAHQHSEEEDGITSPIFLYKDDGGDLRELLGTPADPESVSEDEQSDSDCYPKYKQKLFDINRHYYSEIGRQKFTSVSEMHEVNGHPGRNATSELCKIYGLSMKDFDCEVCNQYNLTLKHSIKPSQRWTEGPNDMVYIDLCDPYPSVIAYDGARYFVLILDDFTGMISVYTVRDKTAETVLAVFRSYRAYAERWHDRKLKVVKTDFGREFENEKFIQEIVAMGHKHESGAAHLHYQNGKAERANRTVENRTEKIMRSSDVQMRYWPEGVKTAAYLYNRTPRPNSIAPHVAWNRKYDARKLYRFGATVFYRDPVPTKKGEVHQKEATFLGYDRRTNGYRLLDSDSGKITTQQFIAYKKRDILAIQPLSPISKTPTKLPPRKTINPILLLRKVKVKENIIIPRNEKEALTSKQSEKWRESMKSELDKMFEEEVFEEVPFEGQKTIDTKWTFDYKPAEQRYSARLVARGDRQLPSQYEHTFAPTMPIHVLRILLCIAINFNLLIWNVDVERAFLNARLNEPVFIRPPALLQRPPGTIIRLRKALYGLKQAGHEWHKEVSATLKSIGFRVMPREQCVFVHESIPNLYIGLYVDDAILVCESAEIKDYVIKQLRKKYRLHDRGELRELLGIQFERFEDRIEYDLQKSIEKLCAQFRVDTDPRVTSPLIAGDIVSPVQNGLPADRSQFVSGLGSILYFARVGRAEIAHPCVVLSQFRETPMKVHERRLKRVMVYLLNTAHYRMTIRASDLRLKVYSDASFASNFDYRSFFGTIVMFGDTVIDWKSKKMSTTAQSTDEAEIIAAYESLRTLEYTRQLICEIIHGQLRKFDWQDPSKCRICSSHTPLLMIDNKSTIAFCQNGFGKRTRQLNVQFIALHEKLQEEAYEVQYVASKDNLADVFTKNLPARVIAGFQDSIFYKI